ncbi:Exopolyphosphatase [Alphaproteobacteria bacterium SO-S41]|nr:Exopolyphosphatase [Alphaproteobacteria bacterium SO-S41]
MTDRSAEEDRPAVAPVDGAPVAAIQEAPKAAPPRRPRDTFAAIDLGTNNCRLLIARPEGRGGFRVLDAFSRSVRLGEGLSASGTLSEAAIERTLAALKVCAAKIRRAGVTHSRAIATEACRSASNSSAFVRRIEAETGIRMEIVAPGEEARLCAQGCAPLTDPDIEDVVVFDIGGGSTELIWLRRTPARAEVRPRMAGWVSVPLGVVSLAERFGGAPLKAEDYPAMAAAADAAFATALSAAGFAGPASGAGLHLLGTSGTVTTLAGIHLGLPRYDRGRIDGLWMGVDDLAAVSGRLVRQDFADRAAHPCVGADRADLVLPGCAILDAILGRFSCARIRIADRGLREGILLTLIAKADKDRHRQRKHDRRTGFNGA